MGLACVLTIALSSVPAASAHGVTATVASRSAIVAEVGSGGVHSSVLAGAGPGYWLARQNGAVFSAGSAATHGSAIGTSLTHPIVGIASTPSRNGYWLVASDGGIFSFGDAAFHGSTGAVALNRPIVGMAATPSGRGYWMVASDGGIFAFGDAHFYGSTGAMTLNKPIVGMTATPSGHGYWMVASDGGIFAFGDAAFYGSTGAIRLNQPIVGIAATPTGRGYWFVAADGGVFAFGDAGFFGSGTNGGAGSIVGIAASAVPLPFFPPRPPVRPTPPIPPAPGATKLAFVTQPSANAAGGATFAVQPRVSLQSAAGATVTATTAAVTLSVTLAGQQTFACAMNPKPAVAGVVTFAGCNIDAPGTYTLTATSGSLTAAQSTDITVVVGPVATIAFTQQPSGAVSLAFFATQPHVSVEDLGHNAVTSGNVVLTITQPSNPSGALLACSATTVPTPAGTASFTGCNIDRSGSFTLHAVDGTAAATSAPLSIAAGAATHLGFSTQPNAAFAAGNFGSQPAVQVLDSASNVVTGDASAVVLTISQPSDPVGATLTCNPSTTKAVVSGVATFAGCNIDRSSTTTFTLLASDAGLTTATSATFNVTSGPPSQLVFTVQPSGSAGGTAFGVQPVVTVEDGNGNRVAGNTDVVTLAITQPSNPVAAALNCTTNPVTAVDGVATFAGCAIDKASVTTYTLRATSSFPINPTTSATFATTVGAAAKLTFTTQPSASTGGVAFTTQPTVSIQDAGGNTVAGDASAVTLDITRPSTPTGAALTCTTNPVTATAGVATFAGCRIDLASGTTYTLRATVTTGPAAATSATFAITTGSAAKLAFSIQPATSTGGIAFPTQPVVRVQDAGGNTVVGNVSPVTLAIVQPSDPVNAGLTCTTSNARTPAAGVATFAGCSVDLASTTTYSLRATVTTGLAAATSVAFAVTVGAASQLGFVGQPSATSANGTPFAEQPSVAVQDAGGNTVTSDNTSSLTLDLLEPTSPAGAVLTCTSNSVVVVTGVAIFSGCSVDVAGEFAIRATSSTSAAFSDAFTVT